MNKLFKKLFILPSPIDLGRSERESLPLNKTIGNANGAYSWEDYRKEVKEKFPIKYFIHKVLLFKIHCWYNWYVINPLYWIKSFLIRRDHMLDLRNNIECPEYGKYTWGYTDCCRLLYLATYKVFENYVDEINLNYGSIEEKLKVFEPHPDDDFEMCKNSDQSWIEHYKEVRAIYDFFNIELPKKIRATDKLSAFEYYDELAAIEDLVTDNLIKIIKMRQFMCI